MSCNAVHIGSPVLFSPNLWSVYNSMENGPICTPDTLETQHRRWEILKQKTCVDIY